MRFLGWLLRRRVRLLPVGTSGRRTAFGLATIVAGAATALFVASALGVLGGSPSNFEAGDGNMTVAVANAWADSDWNCVADSGTVTNCGAAIGQTLNPTTHALSGPSSAYVSASDPSNTTNDDSWASGSKMDKSLCPSVTTSKNPTKDDLTNVASYAETNSTTFDTYLYGATIRYAANGNASENIELQKGTTAGSNGKTVCGTDPLTGASIYWRSPGDQLILIDYLNGGTNVQVHVSHWITSGSCLVSSDSAPCWAPATSVNSNFEGEASQSSIAATDNGLNGQALVAGQFAEFGVDLTSAGILPSASSGVCTAFANAIWESRSSGSSFSSNPADISIEGHTISNCGSLSVTKYIDSNENGQNDPAGTANPTGDVTPLSADLAGWSFTVSSSALSCTGTTDSTGAVTGCTTSGGKAVDLTSLPPGSYTVTENANSSKTIGTSATAPFFNTDPGNGSGGIANPGTTTVAKTVNLGLAGSSVSFGNSCYASAGFEVDGVPTDGSVSSVTVSYTVNGGTAITTDLTQSATTPSVWTGSVPGLRKGDTISWSFYINGASGFTEAGTAFPASGLPGYPVCGASEATQFGNTTINGLKYKDINGNGQQDAGESGVQGFTFQLLSGTHVVQSTRSDSTGAFSFTGVDPGSYTIHEVPVTGWTQTQPAGGADQAVVVHLGDTTLPVSGSYLFGNTPKSKITVTFTPEAKLLNADGTPSSTDATKASAMTCSDSAASTVGANGGSSGTPAANSLTTGDLGLKQSKVTCTVTFTDP
jgi:hypothetical protein